MMGGPAINRESLLEEIKEFEDAKPPTASSKGGQEKKLSEAKSQSQESADQEALKFEKAKLVENQASYGRCRQILKKLQKAFAKKDRQKIVKRAVDIFGGSYTSVAQLLESMEGIEVLTKQDTRSEEELVVAMALQEQIRKQLMKNYVQCQKVHSLRPEAVLQHLTEKFNADWAIAEETVLSQQQKLIQKEFYANEVQQNAKFAEVLAYCNKNQVPKEDMESIELAQCIINKNLDNYKSEICNNIISLIMKDAANEYTSIYQARAKGIK